MILNTVKVKNHCFKRKSYGKKIQQGTLKGYKWCVKHQTFNEVAAGVIFIINIIIIIIPRITAAPTASADVQSIQVRKEKTGKEQVDWQVHCADSRTENKLKSPSTA